jgi:hypothetical protein
MTGVCFKNQKYQHSLKLSTTKLPKWLCSRKQGGKKKTLEEENGKAANKRRNWQTTQHETDRKQVRDQVVPGDELCFLPLAAAALRFLGPEGISLASSSIEMRR